MIDPTELYMFAIVPPPELAAEIHTVRVLFAEKYGFEKALKPPVHITLFQPFEIPVSQVKEFEKKISKIQDWADHEIPFTIDLNNYDYFDNKLSPVLFIDVIRSLQLIKFHKGFVNEMKKYPEVEIQKSQYKPHITIGYRDVDPNVFPVIKAAYSKKTFKASFECKAFYLWKHDRQNWQILKEFGLNGTNNQLALF